MNLLKINARNIVALICYIIKLDALQADVIKHTSLLLAGKNVYVINM